MGPDKLILLVEDNRDDEELAIRALKKNNIPNAVVVARDGVEALEYLFGPGSGSGSGSGGDADAPVLPQVILLDLNLPKLNGLDVLRRIRAEQRTRFLPVVVLTSSKEDEDILNSYSLGANSYVRKPVDFGQFIEAVKTLGQFWLSLNELPASR
jgi:two-component system response regulator